ncbi:UBAP1-MVB12-associated (UMA)-domain containing protein 1 [Cottoperca gobio]|uniref:UBAP1-MVB12-associated (UMA)-domain containing protein 1 n=1 Tax=Cottoperca gobio TaxID=56716 RepID=A0A6J2QMB6_COTGO|nr:UBAP1-MVB12-associated (UMA)-domain containing protein 1 [Cottoperca gobio]
MFSFLGLRKDSKKSTSEVDGGFVIIGETVDEQRRKMQTMNIAQPSTYVIVQPSRSFCPYPALPTDTQQRTALPAPAAPAPAAPAAAAAGMSAVEAASTLPDLLGDVPFTLAPHVLALHAGLPLFADVLPRDINYNLASFQYDFTLENSVLQSA